LTSIDNNTCLASVPNHFRELPRSAAAPGFLAAGMKASA